MSEGLDLFLREAARRLGTELENTLAKNLDEYIRLVKSIDFCQAPDPLSAPGWHLAVRMGHLMAEMLGPSRVPLVLMELNFYLPGEGRCQLHHFSQVARMRSLGAGLPILDRPLGCFDSRCQSSTGEAQLVPDPRN